MGAVAVVIATAVAMAWAASPASEAAAADTPEGRAVAVGTPDTTPRTGSRVALPGLNASGAEFKPGAVPGLIGKTHVYPTNAALIRYAALGVRNVRLPVRWERIQPELNGALSPTELAEIDRVIDAGGAAKLTIILDVHNYARYRGRLVTEPAVAAGLVNLWTRLAQRYATKRVAFGIMNEPFGLSARDWRGVVDRVAVAIRTAGAGNLLLVPGVRWTGAHSWGAGGADSSASAFAGFQDRNFAYEMHQYLDRDSSGTKFDCPGGDDVGVRRLAAATAWLRRERARGFLGEFGAGRSPACQTALGRMIGHMDANADVWMGWSYWTAGAWWPARYEFSVEPRTGDWPVEAVALRRWFARD